MFSLGYAFNELRRRFGRTLVTALGLAAGVGLVMGIIGVSEGLSEAQNRILSPLGSVGTDIIVTRTIAPTTEQTTATTTPSSGFPGGGGGGGGFFARGVAGSGVTASQAAALAQNNASVITDLAKLGKPGTQFTHDFFVPGTLITFPAAAVSDVSKITDVTSAVGALSLQALHQTGTVPKITDTVKTGGQTLNTKVKAPTLTPAQQATQRSCIQAALQKSFGSFFSGAGTAGAGKGGGGRGGLGGAGNSGAPAGAGGPTTTQRRQFAGFANNPVVEKCLTPAEITYEQQVVVPERTIQRVLATPTTNTNTSSYTVAGVDPSNTTTGLVTRAQLVQGSWFTAAPADEVLVNTAYASTKKLKLGGTLTINAKGYKIVGLVSPTLTGNVSDVYFPLTTMQSLSSAKGYVNEVLVAVKNSSDVSAVTAAIKKDLPGAEVLTSKQLADQVSGSLSNAHKLANTLGTALAIVVLLAAFLIAMLLTLSSVAKRVREIGSLRAIGWSRGAVVRQVMAETLGIGVIGGLIGIGVGAIVCGIVAAVGPGLSVTTTGLTVGASTLSQSLLHQSTTGTINTIVHLTAPIRAATIGLAFAGALVGGLLAGAAGGWRAARLAPATALRDLG
ncbi:MAG TPA: ABC transporter permease [Acidimicrobiales bacterium]|nr:ABC transporter permease [Acidimicrobiales bacterium]